jgi:dihydrofolate reductase
MLTPKTLTLLVARSRNGVIGVDNRLPWHLPDDLKRFRRLTMGHPIIMGRRTWESIGRPLPGRRSIVVTRDTGWKAEGAEVAHSIGDALARCAGTERPFVIGGGELYESTLHLATHIELTEIDLEVEGDVWFPQLDPSHWRETARQPMQAGDVCYSFVTLERVTGLSLGI